MKLLLKSRIFELCCYVLNRYLSSILLFADHVTLEFHGHDISVMKGTKTGRMYLTTHRMVFNNSKAGDKLESFSFPFVTLSEVRNM